MTESASFPRNRCLPASVAAPSQDMVSVCTLSDLLAFQLRIKMGLALAISVAGPDKQPVVDQAQS